MQYMFKDPEGDGEIKSKDKDDLMKKAKKHMMEQHDMEMSDRDIKKHIHEE